MKLEDLKEHRYAIKAPQAKQEEAMNSIDSTVDNLIEVLKAEDAKQLKLLKKATPLWRIAAGLWLFSFVVAAIAMIDPSHHIDNTFPLKALIMLIFLGLAIGLHLQIKKLGTIDYAAPVTLFLHRAAARYQFMSAPYFVMSLVVTSLLASAASPYIIDVFRRYFDIHNALAGILTSFGFVAMVYLFGYFVSKREWKKSKGPILQDIRRMQKELQGGSE
ncbi:MAG: hypothetical protein NTV54_11315 [Ignavibacteriales bacterium]|nr:hypothetical protein [Ignavibacteriales bacterium]